MMDENGDTGEIGQDHHHHHNHQQQQQQHHGLSASAAPYSLYEPQYQQLHPLIYYEDPSAGGAHHHHWDHEHFIHLPFALSASGAGPASTQLGPLVCDSNNQLDLELGDRDRMRPSGISSQSLHCDKIEPRPPHKPSESPQTQQQPHHHHHQQQQQLTLATATPQSGPGNNEIANRQLMDPHQLVAGPTTSSNSGGSNSLITRPRRGAIAGAIMQQSGVINLSNRELHNEIERRRRSRIKNCCEVLRTLVPGLSEKTDKASVLEHTVKFINHLTSCPGFNCRCLIEYPE